MERKKEQCTVGLCGLCFSNLCRAAAVGTGQIVLVEFTRIKIFTLFHAAVPCQELQKAAVAVL